jgi:hypothetical protein
MATRSFVVRGRSAELLVDFDRDAATRAAYWSIASATLGVEDNPETWGSCCPV